MPFNVSWRFLLRIVATASFAVACILPLNSCLFGGEDEGNTDTTTTRETVTLYGASVEWDVVKFGNQIIRHDTISVTTPAGYYTDKIQPIFSAKCTQSQNAQGCHTTGGVCLFPSGNLRLDPDSSYEFTVGATSFQNAPMNRVAAGDPDNSYLYLKISMNNPPSGGRMPAEQGQQLSQEEIDTFRFWIMDGAKRN